jgi:RNA polymerase sigma-70 factor (ECF subfamily)
VRGVPAAIEAFESGYVAEMSRALQRLRLSGDEVTELTQVLRQELLVGQPGAAPTLASYSGRGSLGAWVRVTATRKGLKTFRRAAAADGGEDELLAKEAPGDDPELAYLRSLYGDAFRAAFLAAMTGLESRDKNLLRQHFLDGLTIDDLAALHQVHRATAARWIGRARDELLASTRREFARQTNVTPVECESVLRLLQSRLDVTWRRLLA